MLFVLSAANKPIMLSVIILRVIILSVIVLSVIILSFVVPLTNVRLAKDKHSSLFATQ